MLWLRHALVTHTSIPININDIYAAGEYMHGRKQPQIRWLVRKLSTMGAFSHVLDIGGGRGDLAVLIAQTFPHICVTVVDANLSSLRQGKLFARKCGESVYRRIVFVCTRFVVDFNFDGAQVLSDTDIADIDVEASNTIGTSDADDEVGEEASRAPQRAEVPPAVPTIDLVVALHACGGLSDLALHYAAMHQCKFLVCPCCYLKTPHCMPVSAHTPIVPMYRDASLDEVAHSERLAVLRLAESDNRACSVRASHIINSQRLSALQSILRSQQQEDSEKLIWNLQLDEFPKEYSLRNLVLSSQLT